MQNIQLDLVLELFLLPYIDNEQADLEIEILDIVQPAIGAHDENLKWLDYLIQHQQSNTPDENVNAQIVELENGIVN